MSSATSTSGIPPEMSSSMSTSNIPPETASAISTSGIHAEIASAASTGGIDPESASTLLTSGMPPEQLRTTMDQHVLLFPVVHHGYIQDLIKAVHEAITPPLDKPCRLLPLGAPQLCQPSLSLNIHGAKYYLDIERFVLRTNALSLKEEESKSRAPFFPPRILRAGFEDTFLPLLFHELGQLRYESPTEFDEEKLNLTDVCVIIGINSLTRGREDNEVCKPGGIYIILRHGIAGDHNPLVGQCSKFLDICEPSYKLSFAKLADSIEDLIMHMEHDEPLVLTDKYDGKVLLSLYEATLSEMPNGH